MFKPQWTFWIFCWKYTCQKVLSNCKHILYVLWCKNKANNWATSSDRIKLCFITEFYPFLYIGLLPLPEQTCQHIHSQCFKSTLILNTKFCKIGFLIEQRKYYILYKYYLLLYKLVQFHTMWKIQKTKKQKQTLAFKKMLYENIYRIFKTMWLQSITYTSQNIHNEEENNTYKSLRSTSWTSAL